jgi:uncharacterized membrane protein YphA (DoxX/SURF4 family)
MRSWSPVAGMRRLLGRAARWVDGPQPVARLALARMVVPVAVLGFLSSRLARADDWLSSTGFHVPDLGGNDWRQPLYLPALPPWAAWLVAVLVVLAGLSLAVGLFSRPAAGLFAVLMAYVTLADRLEAFTVTKLAPVLSVALCLGPCGAGHSWDAWRRRRRQPERPAPTHVPGGVVRFFQLFLAVMYAGAGVAKLRGGWLSSNVLWSHLHDSYQTSFAWLLVRSIPGWAWQGLQDATLVFEVGAPLWLALRWTRTPALLVGLTMHLMIGLMFGPVVWFALLMGGLLVACYAPERWLGRVFGQAPYGRNTWAWAASRTDRGKSASP